VSAKHESAVCVCVRAYVQDAKPVDFSQHVAFNANQQTPDCPSHTYTVPLSSRQTLNVSHASESFETATFLETATPPHSSPPRQQCTHVHLTDPAAASQRAMLQEQPQMPEDQLTFAHRLTSHPPPKLSKLQQQQTPSIDRTSVMRNCLYGVSVPQEQPQITENQLTFAHRLTSCPSPSLSNLQPQQMPSIDRTSVMRHCLYGGLGPLIVRYMCM